MAQIVTAQFVGQTSCGFVSKKYYEIEISAGRSGCLCVRDVQGQGFCPYSTLAALRKNWKIILAVFVVQIGHAVIPRNIPVLGLGGLHALLCLRFGQTVEQQAGTVGKLGNKTVRRINGHVFVIHALHPFVLCFVLGLLYHAMPRR